MTKENRKKSIAIFWPSFSIIIIFFFQNCASKTDPKPAQASGEKIKTCFEQLGENTEWSVPVEVPIDGYSGSAMEPKFAADQMVLFWNDKPAAGDSEMNIHYAVKQVSGRYQYAGLLAGTVNNTALDGVPAIDQSGQFYFVSLRSYESDQQTVYGGQVQVTGPGTLQIVDVSAADAAVSFKQNGKLDMDIDISWDGTLMVASRAIFSGKSYPDESFLDFFVVSNRTAAPMSGSAELLKNVNLSECRVYAGTLSNDLKELYYTVLPHSQTVSDKDFRMVVAKRNSTNDPFGTGQIIQAFSTSSSPAIVEGPAISVDGKTLFFHKYDSETSKFKIYKSTRP